MPTVIDVKGGDQQGDFSLQLIQNSVQLQQEFDLTYYVVADNATQDALTISKTIGIPQLGTILYAAYCQKITPRATEMVVHFVTGVLTQLWEVDVHFTTTMRNPTDNAPEVDWGGELDKENLEFDLITGAKPTTTAGEPIIIERPVSHPILRIRRRESYPFDPNTLVIYNGRVNATPFWGFPAGNAMMLPIRVEEDTQDTMRVCWVTYEIKFKIAWNFDGTMLGNTWQSRPLNQGHFARPAPGQPPKVIVDKNNHPIVGNLDLNGVRLVDQNGILLKCIGSPSSSLNRFTGVYFIDGDPPLPAPPYVQPNVSDIGSSLIIQNSVPHVGPWNEGIYLISGVGQINNIGPVLWFLNGTPAAPGTSGGVWQIQRAPQFLFFNRAYTAEFNALSLGPF